MSEPLKKENIEKYLEASKIYEEEKGNIIDRIDDIIKTIYKYFKTSYHYWYFDGAEEGEVGNFSEYSLEKGNTIDFIIEFSKQGNHEIFQFYKDSFPSDFLYMTEKEIIDYLDKDKKQHDDNKIKEKEKLEKNKLKKEELKKKALNKAKKVLSKDEIEALKC